MPELTIQEVYDLAERCMAANGCDGPNAAAVARRIAEAERDGSHSHGLFRVPGYVKGLRSGRIDGKADPQVSRAAPGVVIVDGANGFAPLALERMVDPLAEAAFAQGVAVCGLRRIHHFAALWHEVEALAEKGLCAMACTAALPYVAPAGGREPLFGTNPLAFAWPRREGPPYAFDLATSAMARGEIMIARREGHEVPPGTGLDAEGRETTDPAAILDGGVQLPFGGYKGAAVALMVELMAASLIGERFSFEAKEADTGDGGPPVGGEMVLAFDPARSGAEGWMDHAEGIFGKIEAMEGARLAGARRHANRENPGPVRPPEALHRQIVELAG